MQDLPRKNAAAVERAQLVRRHAEIGRIVWEEVAGCRLKHRKGAARDQKHRREDQHRST